jgi:hypothetical protein
VAVDGCNESTSREVEAMRKRKSDEPDSYQVEPSKEDDSVCNGSAVRELVTQIVFTAFLTMEEEHKTEKREQP